MNNFVAKYVYNKRDYFYAIFRIFVGLLFFQHGAQKLLGWFGAQGTVGLFSLMGLAGVIELIGGLLIALGLFTRAAALFGIADMVGAYLLVHVKGGLIPIVNKGELALLYLAAFLVVLSWGSGKWSLDGILFRKK